MAKKNQSEAQQVYIKFSKLRNTINTLILISGLAVIVALIICVQYIDVNPIPFLISAGAAALWLIALCVTASKLNRKGNKLHEKAFGKNTDIPPRGLFAELWEEFEWKQFEGLTDGKTVFAEAYNNTIELEIIRRRHEFNITIDKDALYMVMDEETKAPVEKEIALSEMTDVREVCIAIREFVEKTPDAE